MHKKTRPWIRAIEGPGEIPAEQSSAPAENSNTAGGETPNTSGDKPDGEGAKDWKAEADTWKAHARTWETRAKENKDKADRLDKIEDENRTDLERATTRLQQAEQELAIAQQTALRADIANEFHISKDDRELFLTGGDEDTLRKQAEALANRSKPQGSENPNQGRGGSAGGKAAATAWAESLLGKNRK